MGKEIGQQSFSEGTYGPFCVKWDGRTGLWVVTAKSKRALKQFNVGRKVELSAGEEARVFGDVERLLNRADALIKGFKCNVAEAKRIVAKGDVTSLHGLTISSTNDGLVHLSGDLLPMYRRRVKFKSNPDPDDCSVLKGINCYLPAASAVEILARMKEVEKEILALTAELSLPEIPWCAFRKCGDGMVSAGGRLVVVLDTEEDGGRYSNGFMFPPQALSKVNDRLMNRVEEIRQLEGSEEFITLAILADRWIEGFNASLKEWGLHSSNYAAAREGSWVFLKSPYEISNPHLFNEFGWRWCREDRAWIINIVQVPKPDKLLERIVPMLRYFVSDLYEEEDATA